MNAVMDLTARAVAFITAIQTTLLKGAITRRREEGQISVLNTPSEKFESLFREFIEQENNNDAPGFHPAEEGFSTRAIELVWISRRTANSRAATDYAVRLSVDLVEWIDLNRKNGIAELQEAYKLFPTPFQWREAIRKILYEHPEERQQLAQRLQYLPIQILLALGGGSFDAYEQRIMQMWCNNGGEQKALLSEEEIARINMLPELQQRQGVSAALLLVEQEILNAFLDKNRVPLSFEDIFGNELKEIQLSRDRRIDEERRTGTLPVSTAGIQSTKKNDPVEQGKDMQLNALALSGGGIRSATFNLGILQGLARKNMISKFDYLSTVSGGGYIGSWLIAWIKRDGSLVKVTNRLCPDKSPEPLGEELKPLKWLRMYSNYFAPTASIMSADSWTIAVTWLRNTLLNQIVILLLLLCVLLAGTFLYEVWNTGIHHTLQYSPQQVWFYSIVLLVPVSFLAGLGMQAYHTEKIQWLNLRREQTYPITTFILSIAIIAAYVISRWLSSQWSVNGSPCLSLYCKFTVLRPAAVVTFLSLLLVAIFGHYISCIINFKSNSRFVEAKAAAILVLTAAATAGVGWGCLAFSWKILQDLQNSTIPFVCSHIDEIEFIIGFPLVLEVFSVTLVARMALLGKFFPDERREWWGRMGALTHRLSFLWILVAAAALLGKTIVIYYMHVGIGAVGGWAALVAAAVKAAFNSNISGKENGNSMMSRIISGLALVGPYLFILGLLVFLPGLLPALYDGLGKLLKHLNLEKTPEIVRTILLVAATGGVCCLLAMQVGVNEFSMHHFYRNRLVRAYLGATRRSTDRQRSSNPFTGFDTMDDEKLGNMQSDFDYYGPYPVINAALNASQVTDLDRQDRKAESFIFSPLFCGFDFSMIKASADAKKKSYDYAFRRTSDYGNLTGGPTLGTAMAVSGAAVNPNQGYHSSAATAFLLTVFNAQMGWWMGNPRKSSWQRSEPKFGLGYVINNLIGKTNTRNFYVALSDGGHFDNMGLYEMVRRKCAVIVLCDAEQDGNFACEGFANAVRRCRIDFGAEISINTGDITNREDGRHSKAHYAVGTIRYAGDFKTGTLLYIKSSILKGGPVDIQEYSKKNSSFPHQTTADQFFDEEQFESYRKLGLHIIDQLFNKNVLSVGSTGELVISDPAANAAPLNAPTGGGIDPPA